MPTAFEEFIDFIVGGTTAESVIAYRPSDAARARVMDLIHRQKIAGLNQDESAELDQCLQLEHLLRMVKARACQRIAEVRAKPAKVE
jgi:hypothetical protein